MKTIYLAKWLLVILIGMNACTRSTQKEFQISGKLTGEMPKTVYLERYENKKWKCIDSAQVEDGSFCFKGSLLYPEYLYIKIDEQGNKFGLFVENSVINISGKLENLDSLSIEGSATQNELKAVKNLKSKYQTEQDTIYEKFKACECPAEKIKLEAQLDSLDLLMNGVDKQYIKSHPSSVVSAYLINRELIYSLELDELTTLTQSLDTALYGSCYVKSLNERIDLLKTLQPGMPAPEFSQADSTGKMVNLSDFKGKFVYVDFWASWCGPCRRANPTVVRVYEKYKDKNFTVLGVSMDSERKNWVDAIKKDGLAWAQVSALARWENPVAALYGVNSIPHGILIDPDGKIIKRSVEAKNLDALLATVIK